MRIDNPALTTPASGVLTNATGLPAAGVVGTAAILGANTFTGLQTLAAGADIASATTVVLTAATGNTVVITGTTATTALTMTAGQQMLLLPSGAWPMTYNATTMNINGGVSYTCAAGDRVLAVKDLAGVIRVSVTKQDGLPVSTLFSTLDLGGVADTTISRVSAGVIAVEGNTVPLLSTAQTFTSGQRGTVTALTDAATVAVDLALSNNYSVTLAGNRTLGNPTNVVAGQSGVIAVTQDATGTRTLAYSSYYKFVGGTALVLTTTAAAVDYLSYYVETATRVFLSASKDVK